MANKPILWAVWTVYAGMSNEGFKDTLNRNAFQRHCKIGKVTPK